MQNKENISMSVIKRLPRYHRYLGELEKTGIDRVSSKELSERMGFTASQIRQDFNCFGGFGQQGYGYNVSQLREKIGVILGLQCKKKCILVGAGNLGRALLSISFGSLGFELVGVFDNSSTVIDTKIRGYTILPYDSLPEFTKGKAPDMAIIAIPGAAVERVSTELHALGVEAFWNFSHFDISMLFPDALVENVHLNDSLMTLRYQLSEQ